jgi:hypothetical protein
MTSASLSPQESLGNPVNGYDLVAEVRGDAGRHIADRAQAQHCHRAAVWNVGIGDRLPGCRQNVGEVHEPRIRRPVRDFDVGELGLRDAKQLRLAAGNLAIKLGVAEQRCTHPLVADLRCLTLSEQLLITHIASAAGNLEGDHHSVANGEIGYLRADLADDSHRLVAEDVSGVHEGTEHLIEMQVGSTDVGRRHLDDGVRRLFDLRIRHGVHPHVPFAVPGHCLHRKALR